MFLVGFDDPLFLTGFDDPLFLAVVIKTYAPSGDPSATQYTETQPLAGISDEINLTGLPIPDDVGSFDDPLFITSITAFDDPLFFPGFLGSDPTALSNVKAALIQLNDNITATSLGYNMLLITVSVSSALPVDYPVFASTLGATFPANPGYPPADSISYQGKLNDASGLASGSIAMNLKVLDNETAGSLLYEEDHGVVNVAEGIFNVHIGARTTAVTGLHTDISTAILSSTDLWLEVSVNGDTLSPRTRITPTATAIMANEADFAVDADTVDGVQAADFALKSDLSSTSSGTSIDWSNLVSVPAGFDDGIDDTSDGDSDPTNELQTIKFDGNSLSIQSGNTVILPAVGSDTLATLGCTEAQLIQYREGGWICIDDRTSALEARIAQFEALLAGVSRTNNDITFSGVNVQIDNGTGTTSGMPNTLGNLIVGYNEVRPLGTDDRTGSHNIVVGEQNNFSSYGGLVAGLTNTISSDYATVTGGMENTASASLSIVSSGRGNTAANNFTHVLGGDNVTSANPYEVVGLQDGSITSALIADGTIVNSDVSATGGLYASKDSVYINTASAIIQPGQGATFSVACNDSNDLLVSGSCTPSAVADVYIHSVYTDNSDNANQAASYFCRLWNEGTVAETIKTEITCVDVP